MLTIQDGIAVSEFGFSPVRQRQIDHRQLA